MRHQFAFVLALCLASSVWAQTPATQVAPPTPEELIDLPPSPPLPPRPTQEPAEGERVAVCLRPVVGDDDRRHCCGAGTAATAPSGNPCGKASDGMSDG